MKSTAVTFALLASLCATVLPSHESHAQFNPEGRKKPRPQPRKAPSAPAKPAQPAKPSSKEPSSSALIARYSGIVLNQPGAQFPLQRLAQLFRERDGNLDQLVQDFEKRAAQDGPQKWNALVALAGIYEQDGRTAQAIATYEKAIAEQPQNPIALTALGHLHQEKGKQQAAKLNFERALPKLKGADREQTL